MRLGRIYLVAANISASYALRPPVQHAAQLEPRAVDASTAQLPTCAAPCFTSAILESLCNATDIACICLNTESIAASMTPCLLTSCHTIDVLHTQRYAAVVCGAPVRNDSRRFEVAVWTMFPFALICVVLRFVSRTPYFGGRLGWDDWTILILLMLLLLPLNIIDHYLVRYGLGQDIWMLEEYEIVTVFKLYFAGEILYLLAVTVLKISVLLQYLRIFSFRIWVYVLMAISAGYGASFIIATLAGCQPLDYQFHRWQAEAEGTCINITEEIYASAVINILLDGIITLLPTVQISKLQMTQKRKLLVSFIFFAGFAVTGISIARFVVFNEASEANFTYTYIDTSILSNAELNIAIISASFPAMISLFRRLMGKGFTTKGSSGNTPGASRTPGASGTSGLSSGNQSKKKAARDRWHGFTDVFSTRGPATVVSSHTRTQQHYADYSNDEFELLEDPAVAGAAAPRPQTGDDGGGGGQAHSLGQVESHAQSVDYNNNGYLHQGGYQGQHHVHHQDAPSYGGYSGRAL